MKSGKNLQKAARKRAEKLPGARLEHPFGSDYDVYEVGGKVFLLLTRIPRDSTGQGITDEIRGKRVMVVKADPADALALRGEHAEIIPGYHMNKEHWITVANGDRIKKKLVKDLVSDSYRLVVGTLPQAERPADSDEG
ncbi:MmcQ/YjbR family DNA-binding protein [Corynebacterium halotolerans]|uniref:MmcQ/YjbR family DNA-binding protein n=1 Tax=Corynebacterium halotolerans TaxID=225326 RepID=UPI003CF77EAD